jgi:ATP-binding cassette, subfamily G (WHITE), member 2, PDR
MSFMGGGFGSYDRTAQSTGVPLARMISHDEDDENNDANRITPTVSRTSGQHRRSSQARRSSSQQDRSTASHTTGSSPHHHATQAASHGGAPEIQGDVPMQLNTDPTRTTATSITEVGAAETPVAEGGRSGSSQEKDNKEAGLGGDTRRGTDNDDNSISMDDAEVEEAQRNERVAALARKLTQQSMAHVPPGTNPFLASDDPDSPLNPNGPNFKARAWAKAVVDMVGGAGHTFRTSGVAFQNLNVFGFGSPTDYQKDVVNVWLEMTGAVRSLFGYGKRRIDILRDFDGVVHAGEMLVVLGPPGSGCSTLLKTIAGDYNGIFIDDKSYFNYQGEWHMCREIVGHD